MEGTALKTELTDQELQQLIEYAQSAGKTAANNDPQSNAGPEDLPRFDQKEIADEYGLPFDPEGYYNSAPLEFEETAGSLWYFLNTLHYAATRYNRHSPAYFSLLKELEKNIKQMGSYCINRAVLEKSGTEFSNLGDMSVHELYCMVSLHFRKCRLAAREIEENEKSIDMSLVSWMFRLAALAERLKATEDKIQKIKDGRIDSEKLLEQSQIYKGEPHLRRDISNQKVSSGLRGPSSLPVMKSHAKEVKRQKQKLEKQEKAKQREMERAAKRVEKSGFFGSAPFEPKPFRPMPLPKIPGIGLNEDELKKLLMDEAKSRGDMTEAGIIAAESVQENIRRFYRIKERGSRSREQGTKAGDQGACGKGSMVRGPGTSPSDETRKKLREKRKKRK